MFPEKNVNEAISIGILVADDDLACQNKVAEVLCRCDYEVLRTGTVYDALHAIWEERDRLDVVVTNLQKLESEGIAIIQNIKQRLKLNVLLIHSDERIEPKGKLLRFSVYVVTGVSINGFNNLLENAKRVHEHKIGAADDQQENVKLASVSSSAVMNKVSSSTKETKDAAGYLNCKRKAGELYGDRNEDSNNKHRKGKKPRVTWTKEMELKFLDAIERLGGCFEAVPKRIVEVMGVPGITRENVASHLQKHRCSVKQKNPEEINIGPLPCRSTRNNLQGLGVLTSSSSSMFSSLHSSYIPTVRESKFHTSIGGDLISRVEKLRNMMQLRDEHSSSIDDPRATKFVGYRFIGDQINCGSIKNDTSTPKGSEDHPTSYVQNDLTTDQMIRVGPGNSILQQCSMLQSSSSRIHGAHTEGRSSSTCQQSGDWSESLLDQNALLQPWDTFAHAAPFQNPLETPSTSFSMLPHLQDIVLPPLEPPGNDFSEQTSEAFIDDILQQCCSSPPPPPTSPQMYQNGIGNTCDSFGVEEFDDTLFGQDDY